MVATKLSAFKERLPPGTRSFLGKAGRRLRYAWLALKSRGAPSRSCSVCGRTLAGFVHGFKLCPFCTSYPRHRMFWPLMQGWIGRAEGTVRVMHFAPDKCLRKRLLVEPKVAYVGIDRFTPGYYYPPDTIHGDIENLSQPESSFDLVICSHVLEHVDDDARAIQQLFNVTAPGGLALLCFPFRPGTMTYEDRSIVDPQGREKAFGQWDHLRWYGEDVVDRIQAAGFQVRKLRSKDVFDAATMNRWDLDPEEVFFVCRKPGGVSSLAQVSSVLAR